MALRNANWLAERLGVRPGRVYQLVREGVIPAVRIGRSVRFDEEQVEDFIAKLRWVVEQARADGVPFARPPFES